MNKEHVHQYFELEKLSINTGETICDSPACIQYKTVPGVRVMCAICNHTKILTADGRRWLNRQLNPSQAYKENVPWAEWE